MDLQIQVSDLRVLSDALVCVTPRNSSGTLVHITSLINEPYCEYLSLNGQLLADVLARISQSHDDTFLLIDARAGVDQSLVTELLTDLSRGAFSASVEIGAFTRLVEVQLPKRLMFFIFRNADDLPDLTNAPFSHVIDNDQVQAVTREEGQSSGMNPVKPEVHPMTQVLTLDNGEVVSRKVGPLTYALMWFVKHDLGMSDTIDISDDEMMSEWNVAIGDEEFPLYINCYEAIGLYTLDIYFGAVPEDRFVTAVVTINELNCQIDAGNFQYINGGIRYHNGIIVKGIASDDPEYEGPHLLSPKILKNMFMCAKGLVANALPHLQPFLRTQ